MNNQKEIRVLNSVDLELIIKALTSEKALLNSNINTMSREVYNLNSRQLEVLKKYKMKVIEIDSLIERLKA